MVTKASDTFPMMTTAARARSVPSWLTFYGLNASEQHAWANLATSVAVTLYEALRQTASLP